MTDIAIRVENLSKLYRIGRARQRHDTLVPTFQRFNVPTFQRSNVPTFQRSNVPTFQRSNDLWALRDALVPTFQRSNVPTFQRPKILSRITEPTSGRAETGIRRLTVEGLSRRHPA